MLIYINTNLFIRSLMYTQPGRGGEADVGSWPRGRGAGLCVHLGVYGHVCVCVCVMGALQSLMLYLG